MISMESLLFIGSGLVVTLELLIGGILLGLVLGIALAIFRYLGVMKWLVNGFVSVIRGTPLILQLSLIYFSVPTLLGIKLDIVAAGILSFGLNSAAYLSEIFRAGIDSIPKGQFEAARSLQIPAIPMWKDIIMPQAFRNILPAFINEVIALLKETALISTIGGLDLMRKAQNVAAENYTYFAPLIAAGAYYYLIILIVEYAGKKFEGRVAYVKHN